MTQEVICEGCGENTTPKVYECEECYNQVCDMCADICKNCGRYFCENCYHDHKKKCK